MKSNRIILILIFFGIGYVLYYKDRPGPIGNLWSTVRGVFRSKEPKKTEENPYKAPEPADDVATADNTRVKIKEPLPSTDAEPKEEPSIFDQIKNKILTPTPDEKEIIDGIEIPEFALPAIKKGDQIIRHKNFILKYAEEFEQAAWVVHKLRGEFTKGTANRSGNEFIPDRAVKTQSALSSDYSGSGYDRGHLVPAGDFKCCQELMNLTFVMSNISPQHPNLNRYMWENIESRMRGWSVRDEELFIVTGPVLKKGLKTIGRYNEVAVPEYFYKIAVLYDPNSLRKSRAIAFLAPNKDMFRERMDNYVVTIDEIEQQTGIDFFAKMPKEFQTKLEAMNDWDAWTKIQPN